ncbi:MULTISPECIES: PAQR family membrane homeostasis protein TrhA [unclassified Acinetobacter]|uniref:PAQR family membrane homeostasis protein TrhA n=1 Tax=unclassified Acinetobacter TaxID=196816 RepID=UPI002934B1C7|nr:MULTISPECIES: hemolysin III family protein [unclassified Acinetobacter]WOE30365.1 hemolysin III family protein [Acinetobacter sp. SAAs470]WOE38556.1 hemolysin III family protein [Acinetobacter sp. SAAs474]
MKNNPPLVESYDEQEERINYLSHGLGALLSLIAGVLLIIKGAYLDIAQWSALWIYAISLVVLFSASALYHRATTADRRHFYKKLDHTAIYYLIAGTYTPFLAIAIPTAKAHYLLILLWVIALIGTLFKLVFIHTFQRISLIAYLVMGWLALLVIDDMKHFLNDQALTLLIAGGIAYTVGALFYALKSVRYTHAIWHIFVLMGAGLQFLSIYLYVI